jgi:glycosyltransferase involved in cell wall biosynthesis
MKKAIFMIGTRFDTKGGISSVVNVYRAAGLFDRLPVQYISTHCDGNAWRKILLMTYAFLQFFNALFRKKVGLLHIHLSSRASFWRKLLFFVPAFLTGVPIILHLHGSEFSVFYENECGPLKKRLVRFVFNNAAKILVLSSVWNRWVCSISENQNVITLFNPVVTPKPGKGVFQRDNALVLFLGRLGQRKGTYDLIAACAQVVSDVPNFKLLLAGDGDSVGVKTRAFASGVDKNVEILGWIRGAEKERLLATAGVYVLPSYHEGLPMSILEAMAVGLPILSTNIGGIPEAVTDGVEGFLIEPGDVQGLAARLARLITDKQLAAEMGLAARRKALSTFSTDVVLPKLEKIYAEFGFVPV